MKNLTNDEINTVSGGLVCGYEIKPWWCDFVPAFIDSWSRNWLGCEESKCGN